MSRESLEAFMKKLEQDESLQKELRGQLADPAQGAGAEDLQKFAAGKGYDVNVEEIKGELSDKQLDTVAGGGTSRTDGGGAAVGRANFDLFTCTKGIDTASTL
jgi:predicted ribosomally synthesized peptide with nif11-like leader